MDTGTRIGRYDFEPVLSSEEAISSRQQEDNTTRTQQSPSGRRRINGKPKVTGRDTIFAKCAVLSDDNRLSVNFINELVPLVKHKTTLSRDAGTKFGSNSQSNPNSSSVLYFNDENLVAHDGIFTLVEYPYQFLQHHSKSMKNKAMTLNSIEEDLSVFLKIYEYVHNRNSEDSFVDDEKNPEYDYQNPISKDDETAFLGALFCFLVVDLQSVESANTCFNKLLPIKEQFMPDSFLFVIGMQDSAKLLRRVDISKMCGAVADNDGVYFELHYNNSNTHYERINIYKEVILIQQMISCRIASMLMIRDDLVYRHHTMKDSLQVERRKRRPSLDKDVIYKSPGSDDAKYGQSESKVSTGSANFLLRTPFLDQNLMTDSIGSVLSSCLGTEFWPGFEVETRHLQKIGDRLTDLIENIENSEFKHLYPDEPLEFPLSSDSSRAYYNQLLGGNELKEYSVNSAYEHTVKNIIGENSSFDYDRSQMEGFTRDDDISAYFKIMNIPLPNKIDSFTSNLNFVKKYRDDMAPKDSQKIDTKNSHNALKTAKLRIKLPNKIYNSNGIVSPDKDTDIILANMTLYSTYDPEQQVDAFLLQYGLEKNKKARQKLIDVSIRTIDDLKSGRLESPLKAVGNNINTTIDLNNSNDSGGYNSHDEFSSRSNSIAVPSNADLLTNERVDEKNASLSRTSSFSTASQFGQHQHYPVNTEKKRRRFRIKVKLPNGNLVEAVLTEGDDYLKATEEICVANNITSLKLRQKIIEQVESALMAVIGK